ncbi:hypothetical protein TNCT_158891, partial [Trichonephila clavata]
MMNAPSLTCFHLKIFIFTGSSELSSGGGDEEQVQPGRGYNRHTMATDCEEPRISLSYLPKISDFRFMEDLCTSDVLKVPLLK